jgi:hypothetical protein
MICHINGFIGFIHIRYYDDDDDDEYE